MKKVLSVVLAAAMVLGMSVSAFAENHKWAANSDDSGVGAVSMVEFGPNAYVVRNGGVTVVEDGKEITLEPGDDIYFELMEAGTTTPYAKTIDSDWSINIKGNEYVDNATYYSVPKVADAKTLPWGLPNAPEYEGRKYVKVEIVDELDEIDSQTAKIYMYLADDANRDLRTNTVTVIAKFANYGERTVDYDFTNDADEASVWKAPKNKKGTAVFDFEDSCYFTVKMISEEKVVLNLSQTYNKKIDKAYNEYDADLEFYNFKGEKDSFTKTGELFIPSAKDDKFIYEVVDDELVAVEAEYDDAHKIAGISKTQKGYVIETKDLGSYVVADDELVVAEAEEPADATTTEPAKENPGTGANDFVGAAVALAVVSVAAAGALAFKK